MGTATVGYVGNSGNVLVDSLTWGSRWVSTTPGPTVITVGYTLGATSAEIAAMQNALAFVASVANVQFNWMGVDSTRSADIRFVMASNGAPGVLGQGYAPGEFLLEPVSNPGLTEVRIYRNNFTGVLTPGSYDFVTFLHELGHAMGLAHPHDNGGTWLDKSLVFPGVTPGQSFYDYGDFNLNQGVFTTMSYNDGWKTGGSGGFQSSMMALDILALQHIYGANMNYATGNNAYVLPRSTGGYTCIWDCGGSDTIQASGRGSATIDLRAASGLVEEGGGGFVSTLAGARGGFTIAAGVVIENAVGGAYDDRLTGNDADNRLTGNGGRDVMTGAAGRDKFVFNAVADSSSDVLRSDVITDFRSGEDVLDLSLMDANSLVRRVQDFTFIGDTDLFTAAGQVRFDQVGGQTFVFLNTDRDQQAEATILLDGLVTLTDSDFLF